MEIHIEEPYRVVTTYDGYEIFARIFIVHDGFVYPYDEYEDAPDDILTLWCREMRVCAWGQIGVSGKLVFDECQRPSIHYEKTESGLLLTLEHLDIDVRWTEDEISFMENILKASKKLHYTLHSLGYAGSRFYPEFSDEIRNLQNVISGLKEYGSARQDNGRG